MKKKYLIINNLDTYIYIIISNIANIEMLNQGKMIKYQK